MTAEAGYPGGSASSLADAPATQGRPYLIAILALALVGTALLPFAQVELQAVPEFNVLYVTVVILGDLTTSVLLFGQFRASGRLPMLILAGAYLFTGSIVVPHLLYFSEIAPKYGWFAKAPQTAAWLWHVWHIGFPLAVLAFIASEHFFGDRIVRRRAAASWAAAAAVLGLVLAVTLTATAFEGSLPLLHDGRNWNPITFQLGWLMGGLTAAALVGVLALAGDRRVIHLWLAVALVAFLFDIIPNMLALKRFAFGWYAGRISGILAATFLLTMLIREINALYGQLGSALERLRALNLSLEDRIRERTSELVEANASLGFAIRQRDTLLSELNHRVNNNMQSVVSMLQFEQFRNSEPIVRDVLGRLLSRTRALAVVHHQLFGKPEATHVDLGEMLKDLMKRLGQAAAVKDRKITVETDVVYARADVSVASSVGLLVTELASNALEHAFRDGRPGRLRVSLKGSNGGHLLEVADNGVGLGGARPGYGSRIVSLLAEELRAELTTTSEAGTRVTLLIPSLEGNRKGVGKTRPDRRAKADAGSGRLEPVAAGEAGRTSN